MVKRNPPPKPKCSCKGRKCKQCHKGRKGAGMMSILGRKLVSNDGKCPHCNGTRRCPWNNL